MDKILFLTHISEDAANGVWNKVLSQVNALKNCGYDVDFVYIDEGLNATISNNEGTIRYSLHHKYFVFSKVMKELSTRNYDLVYLRKPHGGLFSLFLPQLISKLIKKKSDLKIIMEIPTYPYEAEIKEFKGKISNLCYKASLSFFKKHLWKILCIGECPPQLYGVQTQKIGNGVDVNKYPLINKTKMDANDRVIFVGVANLVFWHGYDRLIRSIKEYRGRRVIDFYIVGDTEPELTRLKNIAIELGIEKNIHFLGRKTPGEITKLLQNATICVDALGRHRSGNNKNSSIKSKEYTAMGLPFIKSHIDDSFGDEFFIFQVSNDEHVFSINEIIKWYDHLPDDFPEKERMYAVKNLTWDRIFSNINI